MSGVEAPRLAEQDGGYKIAALCIKLLYWQGLWYEVPEPDLEFYQQYFSPGMARAFTKHNYLRLFFRCLHIAYRIFATVPPLFQVLFLYPMGMYKFWENKKDLVGNFYVLIVIAVVFTAIMTMLCHKERFNGMLVQLEVTCGPNDLDNEEQRKMLERTHVFCHRLTKYLHLAVVPTITVAVVAVFVYLLPTRTLFIMEWYPFDATLSPNYEIVLAWRALETILLNSTAITLICFIISMFVYLRTYFKIVIDKIQNLKSCSMENIKVRNVKARRMRPVLLHDSNNMDHQQRVETRSQTYAARTCVDFHRQPLNKFSPEPRARPRVLRVPLNRRRVEHLQHLSGLPVVFKPRPAFRDGRPMGAPSPLAAAPSLGRRGELEELLRRTSWARGGEEYLQGISFEELDREMQKQLGRTVELHSTILRICGELGSCLSIILTVLFVINNVTLAVTALFFTGEVDPSRVVFLAFSLEIVIIYLMVNYMAHVITIQSQAIGDEIYFTDWTGASPSLKKSLLIMMTRANKPLLIKPTGLQPLSLKNFSEVTVNAYKMMSTLNSFMK